MTATEGIFAMRKKKQSLKRWNGEATCTHTCIGGSPQILLFYQFNNKPRSKGQWNYSSFHQREIGIKSYSGTHVLCSLLKEQKEL